MKDSFLLKKKNVYCLCSILFFVIIYLLVPFSARRDVGNYIIQYKTIHFYPGINYYGPLYLLIIETLRALSAPVIIFLLTMLFFSLYFKFKAILRSSDSYFFSIILYGLLIFPIQELITIEAGLAIAVFLFAVNDIVECKPVSYFLKISCAILIHYSALIFVPLYFISSRKINKWAYLLFLSLAPLFALVSEQAIDFVSQSTQFLPIVYANKSSRYIAGDSVGTANIFNFYYSFLYISAIFIIFISPRFKNAIDTVCAKIFSFGVITFYLFSFLPIFAFRFSEMLTTVLVILFPNMFKYFQSSSRIVLAMIILTFSLINLYPTIKLYNF